MLAPSGDGRDTGVRDDRSLAGPGRYCAETGERGRVSGTACRSCGGSAGEVVLDLGDQPACDYFPRCDDPGPDPRYPLQMWLCSRCGLAQLAADSTAPEEPRGTEPAALTAQARDAVRRAGDSGLLPERGAVAEYGSPHGGSWLGLLTERGLTPARDHELADVVIDCFGMMHAANQAAALAERAARLTADGNLLLQYQSLGAIISGGQWNALRHGHCAYYSSAVLVNMLAVAGLTPTTAWHFDLYGGTVLLAARQSSRDGAEPDQSVRSLLARDASLGVADPAVLGRLQHQAQARSATLREWLRDERRADRLVLGYGAASRAVALLCRADIDSGLLGAIADASPAKQGSRMPGTDIPVVSPAELVARRPDVVLLLLADLLAEVRACYPQVEAAGGAWVVADALR